MSTSTFAFDNAYKEYVAEWRKNVRAGIVEEEFDFRFERSFDYTLIRQTMTTPAIYRMIGDDSSPAVEDFRPPEHELIRYVLAYDGDELLGCFIFTPESSACLQVHTCLLPIAPLIAGRSLAAARGVIQWIWETTGYCRIVTRVPDFNRLALRFALKAGMVEFGVNPMSYRKNGILQGQTYLGIGKPGAT